MSPEQITETKSVTAQSDIYSLGVVLWQMVTGEKPYNTKSLSNFQLQTKIVQEALLSTGTNWDVVIQRATDKDPKYRIENCFTFLANLNRINNQAEKLNSEIETIINSNPIEWKNENFSNVKIGTEFFMDKNLNVDRFQNGDLIIEAKSAEEWKEAGEKKIPVWCYYGNEYSNGLKFGKLYNWYAITDPRNLAPKGWRITTKTDWARMITHFGGYVLAGDKIKSVFKSDKFNSQPYNYLAGGYRNRDGAFFGINDYGLFWELTNSTNGESIARSLNYLNDNLHDLYYDRNSGISVKCIKV
jgi:uncharacterized protein (TIGR02145 family)